VLGSVLERRVKELATSSTNKFADNAFWKVLRDIAREEIIELAPQKVDSDIIVPVYYRILSENIEYIPEKYRNKLKSNQQESFRVVNRNLFTSNAFHPDGLANQEGISAEKIINESKKGYRIVYKGEK